MSFDYDLFVIGAGSGGVRASRMSARAGARVAVAESTYLGGTCVNVGCIPKKLFVYGSHFASDFEEAAGYGWSVGERQFDWPTLRDRKTQEIARLNGIYENLLTNAGVTIFRNHATLVDSHVIDIGGKRVTADKILIATGGRPHVPEFSGSGHVITSNEAFYLPSFPEHVVVVGGGYIAVEFAGIFKGLGAQTHLVYRGPLFLRGFDDGVRTFVKDEIERKGISVHFNTDVESISLQGQKGDSISVTAQPWTPIWCCMQQVESPTPQGWDWRLVAWSCKRAVQSAWTIITRPRSRTSMRSVM